MIVKGVISMRITGNRIKYHLTLSHCDVDSNIRTSGSQLFVFEEVTPWLFDKLSLLLLFSEPSELL